MGTWLRNEGLPAALVGGVAGFAVGLRSAWDVLHGAYYPWLHEQRFAPVYPWMGAVIWGAAFVGFALLAAGARFIFRNPPRRLAWSPFIFYGGLAVAGVLAMLFEYDLEELWGGQYNVILAGLVLVAALALGILNRPPARSREGRWKRSIALVAVVMAAVSALIAVGAARQTAGAAERSGPAGAGPPRPNILLITIDTLRADELGARAGNGPVTPMIDKHLVSRGVRFDAAFAQSPWTLGSVGSMMTSLYPSEGGIARSNVERKYPVSGLRPEWPTLAQLLGEAGYETCAQVTNPFLQRFCGIDRGFAVYRHALDVPRLVPLQGEMRSVVPAGWDPYRAERASTAEMVTEGAVSRLREARGEPFFFWVHYLDPHLPYAAPDSMEATEAEKSLTVGEIRNSGEYRMSEARARLRRLYEEEIAYCDRWVGRLLEEVRNLGLDKRTVVILTSDHGEEFWEHGGFEHGHVLHDEVIRVPLVMAFPDGRHAGEVIDAPVRLLDIMPTILEIAGVEAPAHLRGESVTGLLDKREESEGEGEEILAECMLYGPEIKGLRAADLLITYHPTEELFETSPEAALAGEDKIGGSEEIELLKRRLAGWSAEMETALQSGGAEAGRGLPRETREELEALGYL